MQDPIDNIQWINVEELNPNHWNPNVVFNAELDLLKQSILTTGWIQPILVSRDYIIIDGFHRSQLAKEPELMREYGGLVPCAVLDLDEPEAMLMTVRINRAKGKHVAVRMSDLVNSVIDDFGYTPEQVQEKIGATSSEVDLLRAGTILKAMDLKNYKYSKAWTPIETTHQQPDEDEDYERETDESEDQES
jgi:ParB-like chromosome segregation protein Spo0J